MGWRSVKGRDIKATCIRQQKSFSPEMCVIYSGDRFDGLTHPSLYTQLPVPRTANLELTNFLNATCNGGYLSIEIEHRC
jgi:hypothetical protein